MDRLVGWGIIHAKKALAHMDEDVVPRLSGVTGIAGAEASVFVFVFMLPLLLHLSFAFA